MKKAMKLCLLLAVLSAVFLTGAALHIDAAKERVSVEMQTLSGDPSAADGLALHGAFTYDGHLFWDVDFTAGANETQSAFRFSPVQEAQQDSNFFYNGVMPDLLGDTDADYDSLAAVLADVESRTPSGGEHAEIVRLADYYDVYPLYVYLDSPGYAQFDSRLIDVDDMAAAAPDARMQRAFAEAFPFPVDPSVEMEVHIQKDASGSVVSHGYSSRSALQDLAYASAITDEGVYFILTSCGEVPVDFSGLPQGDGIYFLPMAPDENGNPAPDPDGLRNVFPLDRSDYSDVGLYAQDGNLILLVYEGGSYGLTVIDRAAMEPLQQLSLPTGAESQYTSHTMLFEDGFAVLFLNGSRFVLLPDNGAGGYQPVFSHALTEAGQKLSYPWRGHTTLADWDGERLALFYWDDNRYDWGDHLYLAVYSADGLLYEGAFDTSLSAPPGVDPDFDSLAVEPTDLQIAWQ